MLPGVLANQSSLQRLLGEIQVAVSRSGVVLCCYQMGAMRGTSPTVREGSIDAPREPSLTVGLVPRRSQAQAAACVASQRRKS
jgi:hypothetical protein